MLRYCKSRVISVKRGDRSNKFFAILLSFCMIFLLCVLSPLLRVGFHRMLWTLRRPLSYQITTRGGFSWLGSFERISCVEQGQLISEQLLYGEEQNTYFNTEFLHHQTALEMSHLFDLAARCYPVDCLVEFDDYYHYPVYFDFYPDFMIWIEISMLDDIKNCSHFDEMLAP